MSNLGIRSYPAVLRKKPKDILSIKILDTAATVLDDGDFYFIIMKSGKQIVGLVPYESIFNPAIIIPEVLNDDAIKQCIEETQVVDDCLPANWRHTAQQQALLAPLIVKSLKRWRELNPPDELDIQANEEFQDKLRQIRELQTEILNLRGVDEE